MHAAMSDHRSFGFLEEEVSVILVPQVAVLELLYADLWRDWRWRETCRYLIQRLADTVFSVRAVSSSGSGVANPALLHPFGPVGQQTPMSENESFTL